MLWCLSPPPALCNLLLCTLTIRSSVLCVFMVVGMSVVVNVMVSEPTSCLVQPIVAHCCEDVRMCVVNKQFELIEFVSGSVYVDLQYDEISLTFTAVCLCGVCSPVIVLGLSVRLYPMSWVR